MFFSLLADLVVVIHLAFIMFVGAGSLLAWRRPWLVWLHAPALFWAASSITIGVPCPLTPLEKLFRRMGGEGAYSGGFVDHYIEGVVYPEPLTPLLRAVAVVLVIVGYTMLYRGRRDARSGSAAANGMAPR
jgi:hypothetical protein